MAPNNLPVGIAATPALPIPAREMQQWVDETVARLMKLRPRRVLEIGCGTGLLLTQVAPHCESYTGLDFSSAALTQLRKAIEASCVRPQTRRTEARPCSRTGFRSGPECRFGCDYLSLCNISPARTIFCKFLSRQCEPPRRTAIYLLGMCAAFQLLRAYHASVQLYKASPEMQLAELRHRISKAQQSEEELALDPVLFYEIADRWQRVGRVAAGPKFGDYDNGNGAGSVMT